MLAGEDLCTGGLDGSAVLLCQFLCVGPLKAGGMGHDDDVVPLEQLRGLDAGLPPRAGDQHGVDTQFVGPPFGDLQRAGDVLRPGFFEVDCFDSNCGHCFSSRFSYQR